MNDGWMLGFILRWGWLLPVLVILVIFFLFVLMTR